MKINMAAEGDYFNVGCIVACTTCHGQKIQGEVVAFDYGTKMLALKTPAASGKPNTQDVRLLNLSLVSDLSVIKDATEPPPPLTYLSTAKLSSKGRQNVDEKIRKVHWVGVGVSPEGQKVFNSITKTITEIKWEGKNIIVMEEVTIIPPYTVDCLRGKEGSQAMNHVRKIVEKHYRDTASSSDSQRSASS